MAKRTMIKKQVPVTQHQTLPFIATVALNTIEDKDMRAAYIYALRIKGWKLQALADALGLTRERIRQIEAKALRKMRHPSRSDKLKTFLEED